MASETVTDMKGNVVKMEADYSQTVDKTLPECEAHVKNGKLHDALEILLTLEKQTRNAADMFSTSRILVAIVKFCYQCKEYDLLNENLTVLTKRRGQLKQAVTKMVQEACTYVDEISDIDQKLKLIDTLRTVTAGKIYVEIERARLTRKLAGIKEAQGDVSEAANILQELQVETYGSMEKREKVEFILEQMRLCLAKKDYIRTQIISKKISVKFFDSDKEQDLKLKYYQLMIELGHFENDYLTICRHYRAVYDTPCIKEDKDKMKEALRNVILYNVLAPYDNEQNDFLHRIKEDENLDEVPSYRDLLKLFKTDELVQWKQLTSMCEKELRDGLPGSKATGVFDRNSEGGNKCWDDFRKRVVEHNIRVMEKYYTRLTVKRMAQLLDLSIDESEEFLSNLVTSKTVYAKIDRPAGIVTFRPVKDANDILNEWSHNVTELMSLLNKTTHLITKEQMVHQLIET
ncbi:26S proteasome non-ATPase regulatory subunit 12-like [Rhopilema esculentum]|uniref:26S proteasome non-ATPase regulatory subunit 12-like n=1 Tax=Rhopilema esculentum TaxID=499914 RepID=UPI0031CF6C3E|eukprot:gene9571-17323_t